MLRTFLAYILFPIMLCASSNYTVRLAVFKNSTQLYKFINKYPDVLKKTVKTYKKHGYTYAYTLPTSHKEILKKLLPAYRKVFKDAYIQTTKLK